MRKLLLILAAIVGGTVVVMAPHAGASPLPASGAMVPASGSPPEATVLVSVQTPTLPRVTVKPGDSLWLIGVHTGRSWEQLASYNHVPNPNLIYVGDTITIPPASYAGSVDLPAPAPRYTPPVTHYSAPVSHYSAPRVTYTPRPAPVVSAPVNSGGIWGCIGEHESGNNPGTNTGNGYYGAFQDTIGAWREGGGGPGLPSNYSYSQQLAVNQRIQAISGWGAWPNTSRMCGV